MSPLLLQESYMIKKEQIAEIVDERLYGTDKFLMEVLIQPGNIITVYIDGDNSVTISDCQDLSRFIESKLDRDQSDYQLTVSSAGLDRPIRFLRQYRKRIGKELEILTFRGETITGILVKADESFIELEHPVKNVKKETAKPNSVISFENIKKAKLIINFGK